MSRREVQVDRALARRREQRSRIDLDDEATQRMNRALAALHHPTPKETR